jgi:hypothetical protein
VRLRFRLLSLPPALLLTLALAPTTAHAEPTSWVSVGGGYALARNGQTKSNDTDFALDGAVGVGTPATGPLVVGGVFRALAFTTMGVDMSVAFRVATQGYCVGDWGAALDLGLGLRLWGDANYGQFPVHAVLTGGMPFGFQLAVGADVWDVSLQKPVAEGGFVALELDLLRLTSMRSGATTKLWSNPAPANAPPAPAPVGP